VVGCGYAPISSESSAIRQAFYDEVSSSIGCANSQTVVNFFLDANASPGVGVKSKYRPHGAPRSFGPYGLRHVNGAGQEFREFLQLRKLASAASFFRARSNSYATWTHPRDGEGYQLDHWLVKQSHIGRVRNACTRSSLAVDSDHFPVYLEIAIGTMLRRQQPARLKKANIEALLEDDVRQAFADEVGKRIAAHCAAHPNATFEERAEAWRNILPAVALETCGVCERRHQSWFAAFQEQLMVLVVGRNLARAVFKRNSRDLGLKAAAKAAMKTLKQAVRAAKAKYRADKLAMAGHGVGAYWGLVRDLNQGGMPGVTAVPIHNFRDEDGNLGSTPAENVAAAQAHYTHLSAMAMGVLLVRVQPSQLFLSDSYARSSTIPLSWWSRRRLCKRPSRAKLHSIRCQWSCWQRVRTTR